MKEHYASKIHNEFIFSKQEQNERLLPAINVSLARYHGVSLYSPQFVVLYKRYFTIPGIQDNVETIKAQKQVCYYLLYTKIWASHTLKKKNL